MIGEIILLLIILAIVLGFMASGPRSVLRAERTIADVDEHAVVAPTRVKKSRVRFSPEKKERTYNVKTGEIVGEVTVPVGD